MAIYNEEDEADKKVSSKPRQKKYETSSEWYNSVAFDTNVNDISKLITNVEGYVWVGDYYQQFVTEDQALANHQRSQSGVIQQYKKILKMEVKTENGLASQIDQESQEWESTIKAVIYSGLIPNVGDIFVAVIDNGRKCKFDVQSVETLTLHMNSVYSVVLQASNILDYEKEITDDLDSKVIEELQYLESRQQIGLNPFVSSSYLIEKDDYADIANSMNDEYLNEFFNRKVRTFLLPIQNNGKNDFVMLYDPYLAGFNRKTLTPINFQMREYNLTSGYYSRLLERPTVFDNILNCKSNFNIDTIFKAALRDTTRRTTRPEYVTIQWSDVQYYMYGTEDKMGRVIHESEEFEQEGIETTVPHDIYDTKRRHDGQYSEAIRINDINGTKRNFSKTTISDPNANPYYILSKGFYTNDKDDMTVMDSLVREYIDTGVVNKPLLNCVIDDIKNWSSLDRFYLYPIVIYLLRIY